MRNQKSNLVAGAVVAGGGTGITFLLYLGAEGGKGAGGLALMLAVACCICIAISAALRRAVRHEMLWGVLSFVASFFGYVAALLFVSAITDDAGSFAETMMWLPLIIIFGAFFMAPLTIGCIWGVAIARPRVKSKREGLCASCGYDLRGNVSGVCPECGGEALSR